MSCEVFGLDYQDTYDFDYDKGLANNQVEMTVYDFIASRTDMFSLLKEAIKEMIPAFSELMLVTGVRDGFVTRQPEYFSAMLDNLGEHCRLYMAFHEGEPIAGTIAIWYGDKVWYLYGASSNEHRNLMPNYLLQWEMIRWAVEKNCRIYDFRGVPGLVPEDHPLYGLVKFKRGFNGDYTEFVGEMDLILKPFINRSAKLGFDALREVRMKLYLLRHRDKKTDHVKGTPSNPQASGGSE